MGGLRPYGQQDNTRQLPIVLTIGGVQTRIALHILPRERFNDTVNLLRLTRKTDVHEQLANRDVQRVAAEVESLDVSAQRFSVK